MSKKGTLLLIIAFIICSGGIIAYSVWNKPFSNPLQGDAINVTAIKLFNDFNTDESAAQKKYVPEKPGDKTLQVTGEISEIGKNQEGETYYNLKTTDEIFKVKCVMDKESDAGNFKVGDNITLRGFCTGFNMDVIVNRCKIVK